MKEHFRKIDADVIGLSEIDALSGDYPDAFLAFRDMVASLGYGCKAEDRSDGATASAILWKLSKLDCI